MNGYRLLVPAIWLWFHADHAAWQAAEQALRAAGLEVERADDDAVFEQPGMAIEYRRDTERLSVELTHEAGPDAVSALAALERAVGEPDLETGNCWLWSSQSFAIRGQAAEPARRLTRAARWLLPAARLSELLATLSAQAAHMVGGLSLTLHAATVIRVELHVPEREAAASAPVFAALTSALGEPDHITHVTIAA